MPDQTGQEPATLPAEPAHAAPAGDDGHPGTPDGPADRLERELEHARADRQDLWNTRDKRNHRWMEAAEQYQGERDAARAELTEVRAQLEAMAADRDGLGVQRDRLLAEHRRFAAELGFGDDVSEPAASVADMLDPVKEAMSAAADHDECPVHCELCGETLAASMCQRCGGSGCGPGTASGAYEECPECAGVGRIHEGCAEASYADLVAERNRYREHSVTLNSVGWKLAQALGDVPDGADAVRGNPLERADRLIAEVQRLRGCGQEGAS